MQVTTIGLDLAKNIFQIHGVTDEGDVAFNKPFPGKVLPEQTIGIPVGTSLPRALRIAEVHINIGREREAFVVSKIWQILT